MSKARKITLFSIIGVLVAVILTIIILACVPKTFNNYVVDKFSKITVYNNGKSKDYINQAEPFGQSNFDDFKKLSKEIEESSKEKVLTSMFQGVNGFKANLIKQSYDTSDLSRELTNSENKHIDIRYNSEQKVKILDTEIKFYSLIIEVKDTDYLTETKVYFQSEVKDVLEGNGMRSSYQTKILARQSGLFELINKLVPEKEVKSN